MARRKGVTIMAVTGPITVVDRPAPHPEATRMARCGPVRALPRVADILHALVQPGDLPFDVAVDLELISHRILRVHRDLVLRQRRGAGR